MPKITVEVVIAKDIKTVWEHWISPESIRVWCHAGDDWGVGEVTNTVAVGGSFSTEMKALNGSASFVWTGTYTEVVPHSRIAYVMRDGDVSREVEVTFEQIAEGQTRVSERFDPETENSEEMQRAGWQAILNNFKAFVEGR